MHPLVNIAVTAARKAGNFINRSIEFRKDLQVEEKSVNDFCTQVDKKSEAIIIETIHKNYPRHAILGEEGGLIGDSDTVWVIDPLDGTNNFIHGFPEFSISIAVKIKGVVEHAVVYNPLTQDLFTASRGQGASLNDRRIRVSDCRHFNKALIGTGFPFRDHQVLNAYVDVFKTVLEQASDIRRAGSAALDLAYVAAGYLDGFWEYGLQEWDVAAGSLLIREAGGTVTNFSGDKELTGHCKIVAGAPKIQPQLLEIVQSSDLK